MAKIKSLEIPREISFTGEPSGPAYKRLLDFAKIQCTEFSLVWRDDLGNKKAENEIAKELQTFLVAETRTNKWPGTEIFNGTADLCTYELNQDTAKVLATANRLYQWEAPEFPEDLAFYIRQGRVWLSTVAHEQMGWLNTESIDKSQLEIILSFLYSNGITNKKYL